MTDREQESRLLIFDGNNVVMRAVFGMASAKLTAANGVPSGGVYGAMRTIETLIQVWNPSHVLVAFDMGKSTFRTAALPTYKANRANRVHDAGLGDFDQTVGGTFTAVKELLDILGISWYQDAGIEADDHIARAAHLWASPDLPVTIVSADHDLLQLVDENVSVLKPRSGQLAKDAETLFTTEKVVAKYGVDPKRLPELWAMMGDAGDNIPGAPGVGPKRALGLLREHGSLPHAIAAGGRLEGHERTVLTAYKLINLREGKASSIPDNLGEYTFDRKYESGPLLRFLSQWGFEQAMRRVQTGSFW